MIKLDVDFKELSQNLKTLANPNQTRKAVNYALSKVALEMRKDVIPRVPRDTGELVNSWEVQKTDDYIEAGFNLIYAQYQHQGMRADGTYIIRNRPAGGETYFFKNSINANLKKYFDIFEEEVFKQLLKL